MKNATKTSWKSKGFELCSMLFLSVWKSPTLSLTFHDTEISWLFNDISIICISFHIFVKAEFFHVNLPFQKENTGLGGNIVFTTMAIQFASLTLIFKLPFFQWTSLETKILPLMSQMLAFLGTLYILTIKIF